jgi:crotonobetainyl-CoA:carnitine CoA-transferase CaiB-like acyl-CoA transferase
MYGAYGVVAALHERDRTGVGKVVRTSLLAAIVGVHAFQGTRYTVAGEVPYGQGNHHPSICPYGLFHCADGLLQIAVGSEGLWRKLAAEYDLPVDAEGFATNAQQVRNRDAVVAAVDAAFAPHPLAELLPRLAAIGIPAGEVRTLDRVYEWDQTVSQGLLVEVEHALAGRLTLPGPPLRFDGDEARQHQAPPLLGQHDESVRAWLAEVEPAP